MSSIELVLIGTIMEPSNRDFDLQLRLANKKIGPIISEEKLKENDHFFRLYEIGHGLCHDVTGGTIDFRIVDSDSMNAMAVYPTKTIVVCRGALNAILRIGKAIVESELFPEMMGEFSPPAPLTVSFPLCPRKMLLRTSEDFILDSVESNWVGDFERTNLFSIITELLFCFLVCHEIGHHFNKHGIKSGREADSGFDMDEMESESPRVSIDKQALESVADDCGFQILVQKFDMMLSIPVNVPFISLLKNKFFIHQAGLILRCYQIAFIYFYFMESPGWEKINPVDWSYPPAGFRLHTIYASSLENPPLGLDKRALFEILKNALASTNEIISVAFGMPPDLDWLTKMKRYEEHAENVIERMAVWSHDGERLWESYAEDSRG